MLKWCWRSMFGFALSCASSMGLGSASTERRLLYVHSVIGVRCSSFLPRFKVQACVRVHEDGEFKEVSTVMLTFVGAIGLVLLPPALASSESHAAIGYVATSALIHVLVQPIDSLHAGPGWRR